MHVYVVCVCVYVCVYMLMYELVYISMEVRGQLWVSLLTVHLKIILFKSQVSNVNLGLADEAR